jgi:hypothetical protein
MTKPRIASFSHYVKCTTHSETLQILFIKQYLCHDALGPGVYSVSNRNEYQKHKNNVSGE